MRRSSTWAAIAFATQCFVPACARHAVTDGVRLSGAPEASTIIVHNRGQERIYVYLIEDSNEWLLGRLEPLETATLALPTTFTTTDARAVKLAVTVGSSRKLQPSRDRGAIFSLNERANEVRGQEWNFIHGQLIGPWSAKSPQR